MLSVFLGWWSGRVAWVSRESSCHSEEQMWWNSLLWYMRVDQAWSVPSLLYVRQACIYMVICVLHYVTLSCVVCRCVLKMDHHCPWWVTLKWLADFSTDFDFQPLACICCLHLFRVNNCVGYSNYKYFVLFLFYTVVLCAWFSLTGLYDFIRAWVSRNDGFIVVMSVLSSLSPLSLRITRWI